MKQESILDKAALELFLAHNPNSHPATPIGQKLIAGFRKDVEILSLFFDITEKPSANPKEEPPQEEMMKGEGWKRIVELGKSRIVDGERNICSMFSESEEFARLICQAPAMYKALEKFEELLLHGDPQNLTDHYLYICKPILNKINNH